MDEKAPASGAAIKYAGRGVSEQQLREMFAASGLQLLFVSEVEEQMRGDHGMDGGE
jgi:hypothetical protein